MTNLKNQIKNSKVNCILAPNSNKFISHNSPLKMEKILKFKGKFNINPRISSLNSSLNTYYSEQSANEEETEHEPPKNKVPKHKTSKFIEEEEEEKKPEKHHSNTLVIPKSNLKTYETDNSEPNTPNGWFLS